MTVRPWTAAHQRLVHRRVPALALEALLLALSLFSLPARAAPPPISIDITLGSLSIDTAAQTYSYNGAPAAAYTPGTDWFDVTGATVSNQIKITGGLGAAAVDITFDGASMTLSGVAGACPFALTPQSTVNLTLAGANTLSSPDACAGLQVPAGAKLTITTASTGKLTATGGTHGAGIGGGQDQAGGAIIINGGDVTANGGGGGAGIGGGGYQPGGIITITGTAQVHATGGSVAAGGDLGGGAGIGSGGNDNIKPLAAGQITIDTTGTVSVTPGTGSGVNGVHDYGNGAPIGQGGYDGGVNPGNGAGVTYAPLTSQSAAVGSTATFTEGEAAVGTSAPTLTYAWTENGAPAAGATAAFTTAPTTLSMNGYPYTVLVTAPGGSGSLAAADFIKITYNALLRVGVTAAPVPTLGLWTLLLLALLLGGMVWAGMPRQGGRDGEHAA